MKGFKNFISVLLSIIGCICFAVGLSACSNGNNTESTQDKNILAVYNMYVAYAEENNTTPLSYSDWLLTIKGEKGDKGEQGIQGVQGEQGIQGEKGEKGDTGEKGEQGPAGINGTNGTNGKDGVDGVNGKDGVNGTNGINGQDGKSAYQIWLDNGNEGTETDFLNWLKGSDGADGVNGADGKDGLGIKNATINDDGDLIITFDNDTTINAGNVVNKSNMLNENNKITFNTLEVTENNVYGKVSNETETFSFIKEINLIGNAGYTVYTDLQGTNSIPTKTVSLEIGDNTFYVLETCGNDSNLYTVTIRRKPIYTVSFVTTGENSIPDQQVEEDSLITAPVLERAGYGYTFDYDITTPITSNTTITATETAIFILENDTISDLTTYGKTLSVIDVPNCIDGQEIKEIQYTSFSFNKKIKTIKIQNGITTIHGSFYGCSSLTNITIPNSVTRLGDHVFAGCTSLTSIIIPNGVTKIESYAFSACTSLTNIIIPDSVTEIAASAFNNCSLLQYNEYNNANYLGNETNKYLWLIKAKSTDITSCTINENCKFVCKNAFEDCKSLMSIIIGSNVTSIEYLSFYNCTSLMNVTIGNSVTSINSNAFYNCEKLTNINYSGTIQEWNNIEKITNWNAKSNIKTITCTDGTITL